MATVKALACELPTRREQPLSRSSTADLTRLIAAHPAAPPLSASTLWRILDTDALKPWQHQRWRYPRDPQFAAKAGRVLDRYAGWWAGRPLHPDDCIISADEQTSIQARVRLAPTTPPRPGQPLRVEHEYARGGALAGCPLGASPPGTCGAAARSGAARPPPASSPSGNSSRR